MIFMKYIWKANEIERKMFSFVLDFFSRGNDTNFSMEMNCETMMMILSFVGQSPTWIEGLIPTTKVVQPTHQSTKTNLIQSNPPSWVSF